METNFSYRCKLFITFFFKNKSSRTENFYTIKNQIYKMR